MHLNVYNVFYSLYSHHHVSAVCLLMGNPELFFSRILSAVLSQSVGSRLRCFPLFLQLSWHKSQSHNGRWKNRE